MVFSTKYTTDICVLGAQLGWELFESDLLNMFERFLNGVIGVQYSTVLCKLFSPAYIKGNIPTIHYHIKGLRSKTATLSSVLLTPM